MNQKEFLKRHGEILDSLKDITVRKNSDYAGSVDPFKNFRLAEFLGLCSTEVGMIVRLGDKMSRISNLIGGNNPKVKDESIKDTLLDLANYCIITVIYLESKCRK